MWLTLSHIQSACRTEEEKGVGCVEDVPVGESTVETQLAAISKILVS